MGRCFDGNSQIEKEKTCSKKQHFSKQKNQTYHRMLARIFWNSSSLRSPVVLSKKTTLLANYSKLLEGLKKRSKVRILSKTFRGNRDIHAGKSHSPRFPLFLHLPCTPLPLFIPDGRISRVLCAIAHKMGNRVVPFGPYAVTRPLPPTNQKKEK